MLRMIYIYIYVSSTLKCSNDSSRLWWNWQFCKDLKIGVTPFPSIGLGRRTTTKTTYLPASLVAPLPSSEQTNLPSSNHTYTKSTPKHIHHHYAPSVTSTHTSLQLHPHTHHIVAPGFVDRPRRSDCTAGQMDGEAGWWTTSGNIGLPPLARVMGVGTQQHGPPPDSSQGTAQTCLRGP